MAIDFVLKRGDRSSPLRRTLTDFAGEPVDLTSKTVKFFMTNVRTGAPIVNGVEITPVDAALGIVQYEWEEGTTDLAGDYRGEFQTTDPEGLEQSFPNDGYIMIQITPKGSD
jgi:hypothetical protein